MKKKAEIWLAAILCMIISVTVSADIQNKKTEPDYKTDYYMIVESKAGGIDIYANPDLESAKLSEDVIPNGTALHIEGEVEDEAHRRTWGYVQYHGMNGFVPLDDCRPAASRQEAIDSELYLAGRDNVDYQADYDITVSEEDDMKLYQGPGEKYGAVPGVRDIKSGETLHITQDAHMNDGSYWGVTTVDGKQGWVNLDEVQKSEKEEKHGSEELTGSEKTADRTEQSVSSEEMKTSVTPVPTITEKPEVSPPAEENPAVTSTPKSVSDDSSEKKGAASEAHSSESSPAVSENPESSEVTGESNKESGNSKEKKETAGKNTENSTEEKSQETSGQTVKTSSGIPAPFLWIAAIAVGAVAGVLIYHFKKR